MRAIVAFCANKLKKAHALLGNGHDSQSVEDNGTKPLQKRLQKYVSRFVDFVQITVK